MFTPKTALFTFVATCALAMGACQPAEGPAEQAGLAVDNAARQVGQQLDKAADKVEAVAREADKKK
jgi:hypothetical protein